MKSKSILFIGIVMTTLNACSANDTGVMSFEECIKAGNPVMESYPKQCIHEGQKFTEGQILPEEIEKEAPPPPIGLPGETGTQKPCTREYKPVCGEVQVQCVKAPCPPLRTTFENRCLAENAGAKNIADGACVEEGPHLEGACLSFDGNWLEETQECEGMSQEQCSVLGGTYNECASACRNDPNAEICTMQCVQVCEF